MARVRVEDDPALRGRSVKWEEWIPTRKVTAGAFAAAFSFLVIWILAKAIDGLFTAAEGVAVGSALTVIVAYIVPERNGRGPSGDE